MRFKTYFQKIIPNFEQYFIDVLYSIENSLPKSIIATN